MTIRDAIIAALLAAGYFGAFCLESLLDAALRAVGM